MRQSWSETFRALGTAVLGLIKAEIEALEADLARSGKNAALGVGLFFAAAAAAFWTLGVATYFVIHLLAVWLPLWAAALIVTLLLAGAAAALAFAGVKKLEKFENPLTTVRRRMDDHIDWWQDRALAPETPRRRLDGPGAAGGGDEAAGGGAP